MGKKKVTSRVAYILDDIHFHIGQDLDEDKGTEHSVDGEFFTMEVYKGLK